MMSMNHLKLLSKAIQCYDLPKPIFIENSIAFGISFGFLAYSKTQEEKNVVIVNCGDVYLIVSVMQFQKNSMELLYMKSIKFGGRLFSKLLLDYVIKKTNREDIEPLTKFQLLQEMAKWKTHINTHQVNTTFMSIIGAFGNESSDDLELLINHQDFEDSCRDSLTPFIDVLQSTKKVRMGNGSDD